MRTIVLKGIMNARTLLRSLPGCTCFPKINGFEVEDKEMKIVIGDLEEHPSTMEDDEFIRLVKSIYNCALRGITFGLLTRDRIRLQGGKTVLIPNFNARARIVSGRIENPDSFFTTIQSLATIFRDSCDWASRIHRQKISGVLSLMKELSLSIPSSFVFLPSLGVWRHDKFVEILKAVKGHVFVPMIGSEKFVPFLRGIGKVFSSIEEIKKEIYEGDLWRNIFSDEREFSNADLTALALIFPVHKKHTYIFNTENSVEMHTFCNEFRKIHPNVKVIEFLAPYFRTDLKETITPPRISSKEIGWFLRTFFGSEAVLKTNLDGLFEETQGELFAISTLISLGKWSFVNDVWEVYPSTYVPPKPVDLIKKARSLSKNGEKPTLGLELVETAENICGKKLECFESLKAFFYKVLGKYEEMQFHFKEAEKFGNRPFRNAYYSIVLAMNGMSFFLSKENASPLVNLMRRYALLVSQNTSVDEMYVKVISPLEKIISFSARRIECMARNYIGIRLGSEGKIEEAVDELETSLSIAHEYKFKDLEPLIELNIASFLSDKAIMRSHEKAFNALKHSMNEGLKKIISISYLLLASNSIEMGDFKKADFFLLNAEKAYPILTPPIQALKVRMKVEDLNFDEIEKLQDDENKEELKFLAYLYTENEEKISDLLKSTTSSRIKRIRSAFSSGLKELNAQETDYLLAYFLARSEHKRNVLFLKNIGKNIYMNNINIRKIFYEEQLSVAYRMKGLKKSADYHMNMAVFLSKQFGLKKRASYLSKKISDKTFLKDSYRLFTLYLSFRYFASTYEIVKSLALNVSEMVGTEIICELSGIENYKLHALPSGMAWKTNEKPDLDFAWVFGKEFFAYLYFMKDNTLSISFKTEGISMDETVFILDHLIPFYAIHIEKSLADKVSNIDSLTKLYSRRYIMNKLTEEVERAQRYNEALSVAMLDIDDFKRVNDKNGHDIGDEVLRRIAELVMDNVRSIDIVGRYGGEEFLIIFPHTPLEHAVKSCERIRRKVESARIIPSNLTVSIGIAELKGKSMTVDELIKKADISLYLAKSYGKNRVVSYHRKVEV